MQAETDYMEQGEASQRAYAHYMKTDPDMRDFLGKIETVDDPLTGRTMRRRAARIGMVRGAKEENLKETTVWLDPVPHIRVDKGKDLQGWYSSKGDGDDHRQRDRPCYTDAVLTSPYSGYCSVGCAFCYVNSGMRGYRGSGLIAVPVDYGDHVSKQLRTMRTATAGYFSSFTDPFLPLEDYYHNTQRGVEAFTREGLPVFFLSRLRYPGWAIDALQKNKYSYAQKSINCHDEDDWKKLSPGAASLAEHMDDIRELRRKGVYVSIQVNPIVPGIVTHDDVESTIEMLAEAGANHVIFKFVEAGFAWAGAMEERITKRFGDNRAAAFKELFKENQGGGQRTILEEYRREGHARYQARAMRLGLTTALCYEFTRTETGRWRSLGPEFLSADQCHGHRVPMFARPLGQLDVPFAEVAECPPSGCLTCADDNEGDPRCGSGLLGEARALRLPDFRRDPGITAP